MSAQALSSHDAIYCQSLRPRFLHDMSLKQAFLSFNEIGNAKLLNTFWYYIHFSLILVSRQSYVAQSVYYEVKF